MDRTDEELVAQFVRGDEKAFADLVDRYLKSVYSFIFRFVGSELDAEDITQETFLKIWKNLKHYNQNTSRFKTWAMQIARNSAIDHMRKKKQIAFSRLSYSNDEGDAGASFAESIVDAEPLPDELFAKMENARILNQALEQLSPAQREVLVLHYTEHLTFEEIGKLLDEPQNTVKSRHHRGLQALRTILANPSSDREAPRS